MKKIIGLLMLLVAFTAFMGPEGPAGSDGGVVEGWRYITVEVDSKDWQLINDADGNPYYYYEVAWDELNDYVFEEGIVLGNLYTFVGDAETITSLPYIYHRQNAQGQQWTETYFFDYSPGWVAFYAKYSDFAVEEKPATMKFRVSILW